MTADRYERMRDIFLQVVDLPPSARSSTLDELCGDNVELRAEVERLLTDATGDDLRSGDGLARAAEMAGGDPSEATDPNAATIAEALAPSLPAHLPKHIGKYHLRGLIGQGGMATVYLAVQEHPRRNVALKLMKPGIASASTLRRFEFESQILGRLHHPYIAQVYEAGTHGEGAESVPYFAMEYIPNAKPITEFADARKLGTRDRLRLFAKVCDAVHHGHQKGIIHRDLKPTNILVDSTGEPKIIDFGVARATDSDLAVTTLQTDVGQLIGTLQYMSPEQCAADPMDVDLRSDVYALGVVLYELLCRRLPYDMNRIAVHEAARLICESSPQKPSTVDRRLRGDIETIALTALEKDRDRRYQSARELARDIERYLGEEAIEARPPSLTYQASIFARRHRGLLAAVAAVFIALVTGLTAATIGLLQARRDRDAAEVARLESDAVTEFLSEMLAAAAPSERGPDLPVRAILDSASSSIGTEFEDAPVVQTRLRTTIGNTYLALGLADQAALHFQIAREIRLQHLGAEHEDTLEAANNLAVALNHQRRYDEARTMHEQTLERRRERFGDHDLRTLQSMNNLAVVYRKLKRHEDASSLFEEALAGRTALLGSEHPDTLGTLNNLALVHRDAERYVEFEAAARTSYEGRRRTLGPAHPETLRSMNSLGVALRNLERYDEAEALYLEGFDLRRSSHGVDHPKTISSMYNLAVLYHIWGELDKARAWYDDVISARRRLLGPDDKSTVSAMYNLGVLQIERGEYEQAAALLADVARFGRWNDAGRHLEAAYQEAVQADPQNDVVLAALARAMVLVHDHSGRKAEAERWRELASTHESDAVMGAGNR